MPADIVNLVPGVDHESVRALLRLRGLVDLVIPRGGAGLIRTVVEEATVPVIETGVGNCHIYVDEDADLEMALRSCSTRRPSARASAMRRRRCSSTARSPPISCRDAAAGAGSAGVTVHGDPAVQAYDAAVVPANDADWADEYLSLDIAVRVVTSLDEALEHIRTWSSGHTEAIITRSLAASRQFIAGCDSAAVMVNASTRFTDGEQLGMGAEIGISTQKMHARGPMGLAEMTSTKWVITGDGQIRE